MTRDRENTRAIILLSHQCASLNVARTCGHVCNIIQVATGNLQLGCYAIRRWRPFRPSCWNLEDLQVAIDWFIDRILTVPAFVAPQYVSSKLISSKRHGQKIISDSFRNCIYAILAEDFSVFVWWYFCVKKLEKIITGRAGGQQDNSVLQDWKHQYL